MKKRKNSLFRRMLILTGIIISVLILTYLFVIQYVTELNKRSVLRLNERTLQQVKDETEEFRDSLNHIATTLVYSPTTYEYFMMDSAQRVINNENMTTMFLNTTLLEADIVGIYLYDSQMHMICGLGEGLAETDHIESIHVKKDHMEFGNLFTMEQSGMPYYILYFPVYDLSNSVYGKQIGMSALILRPVSLVEMVKDVRITENSEIYILDGNDRVVGTNRDVSFEKLEESQMETDSAYFVKSESLKLDGWKVVSRIPKKEMESESTIIYWFITASYLGAFLLIGGVSYFCYKQMVVPLYQIDSFIKKIVSDPDDRMMSTREDEIGTVINSLNHMLDEKKELDEEVKKAQEQMYEAELAKKQLQVLAYRNQINPHFLYNTFDCIRAMALYHDADEIAEITLALSHVFRYAVKAENVVRVEEEVNYIKKYASIIEYRFNEKIDVNIKVDDNIKKKNMIKLILQPLVENAVFHGLEQKIEGGRVDVTIRMADADHICFTVEDNGCGMTAKRLKEVVEMLESEQGSQGIGMSNIFQRLRLFYGEDITFTLESSMGQGTKVIIIIPDEIKDGGTTYV